MYMGSVEYSISSSIVFGSKPLTDKNTATLYSRGSDTELIMSCRLSS